METAADWYIDEAESEVLTSNWDALPLGGSTDYLLVTASIVHRKMPYIGPGRWTMPLFLTEDEDFLKKANSLGKKLEKSITAMRQRGRTNTVNPQAMFKSFKDELTKAARQRAKIAIPTIVKKIRETEEHLEKILQKDDTEDKINWREAVILQEEICALEAKRYSSARNATATKYNIHGESFTTKYWSKVCKPRMPRNIVYTIAKPPNEEGLTEYETRSERMAELAKDYHDSLQKNAVPDQEAKEKATEEVLKNVERQATAADKETMEADLTSE